MSPEMNAFVVGWIVAMTAFVLGMFLGAKIARDSDKWRK